MRIGFALLVWTKACCKRGLQEERGGERGGLPASSCVGGEASSSSTCCNSVATVAVAQVHLCFHYSGLRSDGTESV